MQGGGQVYNRSKLQGNSAVMRCVNLCHTPARRRKPRNLLKSLEPPLRIPWGSFGVSLAHSQNAQSPQGFSSLRFPSGLHVGTLRYLSVGHVSLCSWHGELHKKCAKATPPCLGTKIAGVKLALARTVPLTWHRLCLPGINRLAFGMACAE